MYLLDILRIRQLRNCQINFENNQVVPIKWNIWSFTRVRRSHLVRCLLSYTLNSKKQRKKCQNLQNSRRFLLDRVSLLWAYVYSSRTKMNWKLVFIAFSACKQNLRASLIWGKELEVFLFMFKWSFICHFMIYVNVL